jgi:hypothetical protein
MTEVGHSPVAVMTDLGHGDDLGQSPTLWGDD